MVIGRQGASSTSVWGQPVRAKGWDFISSALKHSSEGLTALLTVGIHMTAPYSLRKNYCEQSRTSESREERGSLTVPRKSLSLQKKRMMNSNCHPFSLSIPYPGDGA